MHMFCTWLWRKCLSRSCSKTDARSVMFASGGLFASEAAANGVFADRVCPGFCEARDRDGEAFVNGRQLRRENGVLGTERQSRWRRGDVEEQVLILTDHAWLNHLSVFFSLSVLIFTAVAGAAPQAPSPTDSLRPPCTSPTTHRLLRQPRQPPLFPWPCPLTRITPTASRLPCSRLHTHTTPICLLLQQPCLHRHH